MAVGEIEVPARLAWRLSLASFVLAGVTLFLLWVAVTALLSQDSLGSGLSAGWAELAAPLLVGLVVVTGICERIWPAEPRPVLARGHVQDACFLALHAVVVIPVTIVAMDAANWLAHYADHRFTALWRFHALYHSQEELSVVLTVWDVLAGRARFPSRVRRVGRTGLDGRPVPVEQDDVTAPPLRLMAGQLIEPFQAQRPASTGSLSAQPRREQPGSALYSGGRERGGNWPRRPPCLGQRG